jgi:hypothetical protein
VNHIRLRPSTKFRRTRASRQRQFYGLPVVTTVSASATRCSF